MRADDGLVIADLEPAEGGADAGHHLVLGHRAVDDGDPGLLGHDSPSSARWTDVTARGALGDVAAVVAPRDADPRDGVVRRLSRTGKVTGDGGDREDAPAGGDERAGLLPGGAGVQDRDAGGS